MIRCCANADFPAIEALINEAAQAYRGVIPTDCWHEPYMTGLALKTEARISPGLAGGEGPAAQHILEYFLTAERNVGSTSAHALVSAGGS